MARIFEALKGTDTDRRPPVARASDLPDRPPAEMRPEAAGTVPFIEVGGGAVEGTPDVLGTTRDVRGKMRKHAAAETPFPPPHLATFVTEPEPVSVMFRPVPCASPLESARDRFAPELLAFHEPEHPVSRQYGDLLASLCEHVPPGSAQVLLLSGTETGVGTTTALLNLAISQARHSTQPVVVVDAGVHRPAVAERLGLSPAPGLREVLTGSVPLQRALRETGQPQLLALTLGETGGRVCLGVKSLVATLGQLRRRFPVVFVDAPSWNGGPEMTALAAACDAVYLVVPRHKDNAPDIRDLVQVVLRQGIPLRGCILTQR